MRYEFTSVAAMPPGFWRWFHFDPAKEWADKASGKIVVETDYMDRLELLRDQCGFPLPVNSGYRTPEHNAQVSFTGTDGPHTTARASDIRIYGVRAFKLVEAALACGFTGIGLQQKGPIEGRYCHLDDLPEGDLAIPRPMVWTY